MTYLQFSNYSNDAALQALFNAMDDLIVIRDRSGRCVQVVTPQAKQLLYRSPHELLGKTLHEVMPQAVADRLLKGIQTALHQRQSVQLDYSLPLRDRIIWFDARISPIDAETALLVIRDVSDRKQWELDQSHLLHTLQTQAQQLRLALELNHIGRWDLNLENQHMTWDAQFCQLLGLPAAFRRATYPDWLACIHPDDVAMVEQRLQSACGQRTDFRAEYRVIYPDGSIHWISTMGAGNEVSQAICQLTGIAIDISDRKRDELQLQQRNTVLALQVREQSQNFRQSQTALRSREQELNNLLEHLPDVIARFDRDFRCVYVNPAITTITGLEATQLLGKTPEEMGFVPELLDLWQTHFHETLTTATETSLNFQAATPHGYRYFETRVIPECVEGCDPTTAACAPPVVETILTISRDMTALKAAEIALRQGQERFRKLFENSPIAIALMRITDGHFIQMNPAYATMLGYSEAELLQLSCADFSHPDDMSTDLANLEQLLQGERVSYHMDKRFFRKDGSILWTKLTVTLLRDADGSQYSMGMIEDISEHKRAQAALQESEEKFRSIFENAPLPMGLADIQTRRILRVNAALQQWLGYSYDELYAMTYLELTHPDDVDSSLRLNQEMKMGQLAHFQLQKRYIRKSGDVVWARISTSPIRDRDGTPLYCICVAQDITQSMQLKAARDQAEAALRQQSQHDRLLRVITQHIHQSLDLDEILAIAVEEVRQTLNADRVLIFRIQPDCTGVVVEESVAADYPATKDHNQRNSPLSPECYRLYLQGVPRIVMDIADDECSFRPVQYLQAVHTQTKITAPIVQFGNQGNTLWGLITVHSCASQRVWQADEAELLQQIANQLAIAIQQATLYHQVQVDLIQQQEAETHLRSLLQEKEILLKEVHHRVKNNLQVISSLLRMQSRQADPASGKLFEEAQNRVQAIAIIHEHLYQATDLSHINVADYVQILVNNLCRSYGVNTRRITIHLQIEPLDLSFNAIIPCGLIINELVSNSLKYAFPDEQSGTITIALSAIAPADPASVHPLNPNRLFTTQLSIQDDGISIPAHIHWQTSRTLGLRIVRTLVSQLDGHITQSLEGGTTFHIRF